MCSAIQLARDASDNCPAARASHVAVLSAWDACSVYWLAARKISAAVKDVRLLPSINGWLVTIPWAKAAARTSILTSGL